MHSSTSLYIYTSRVIIINKTKSKIKPHSPSTSPPHYHSHHPPRLSLLVPLPLYTHLKMLHIYIRVHLYLYFSLNQSPIEQVTSTLQCHHCHRFSLMFYNIYKSTTGFLFWAKVGFYSIKTLYIYIYMHTKMHLLVHMQKHKWLHVAKKNKWGSQRIDGGQSWELFLLHKLVHVCCFVTKEYILNRIGECRKLTSEVAHKYTGENSWTSSRANEPKTRSPGTLKVKRIIIVAITSIIV